MEEEQKQIDELQKKIQELESRNEKMKSDNEELRKAKDELAQKILESNPVQKDEQKERKERIKSNRDKLRSIDMLHPVTDLEFAKTTLELRKDILEEEGVDIFLPNNKSIIKDSDKEAARKTAEILQECVDEAKEDPNVFKANLKTALAEDSPELISILQKRKNAFKKK